MGKDFDRLFYNNVPNEKDFIWNTFFNRNDEIKRGKRRLTHDDPLKKIYAIYGFSRVGKSHLAMYLAEWFADKHDMTYFYINTNTKETAFDILCNLYERMTITIDAVDKEKIEDKDKLNSLEFLNSYIDDINKILYSAAENVTFTNTNKKASGLSPSLKAKIPVIGFEVKLSGNQGKKVTSEESKVFIEPNIRKMRRIISICIPIISYIIGKKILMLFDDLDLLDETSTGKEERDALITQLKSFAEIDDAIVLITCRNNFYMKRKKDMHGFINAEKMNENDLKMIYFKRIEIFYDNEQIFDGELLDFLAKSFDGRVGSFLNECNLFFDWAISKNLPLSKTDLREYLNSVISEFRDTPETRVAFGRIEEIVKQNESTIIINDMEESDCFLYRIVIPGYKEGKYEILPIFAKTILGEL